MLREATGACSIAADGCSKGIAAVSDWEPIFTGCTGSSPYLLSRFLRYPDDWLFRAATGACSMAADGCSIGANAGCDCDWAFEDDGWTGSSPYLLSRFLR